MHRWKLFLLAVAACTLGTVAPLRAEDPAAALLAKIAAIDPGLNTYRADVAFDVGLRSFPFVRRTLHGAAYFKRPARMELILNDLPAFARGFSNVYVGLGTPSDWEKKFDITSAEENVDGRIVPHLVLTPRHADRRLRSVEVYLDRDIALPARIVWNYKDGRIDLHQKFAKVDGHDVIVGQETDIRLPAVHAFANAKITNYAINVDVPDHLFTKRIETTQQ